MILFPNCKINLGLDVLRRRSDGFHDLDTVMVPVCGLCDILEIVPRGGHGAEFSSSGLTVDCPPENNLCLKAYRLMAEVYPQIGGVHIHLHKIIPFGAGLGGGSSDAAFTVKGLDKLFGLALTAEEMESVAARLGSDTAFFIRNITQSAQGRGEVLSPVVLPQLVGKRLVIVKPYESVSTAEAYAAVKPHQPAVPLVQRLTQDIIHWRDTVTNSFETHIFAGRPAIARIKDALYDLGAIYASMSGSGSAVFGIFDEGSVVPVDGFADAFVYQQVIE